MADYGMAGFGQPDFVMLGVTIKDGVMLVASDTLTRAEIEQRVDRIDVTTIGEIKRRYIDGIRWAEMHAEMHDLKIVYAADYASAFRDLFADWQPGAQKQKRSIEHGRRSLPPGRLGELIEGPPL